MTIQIEVSPAGVGFVRVQGASMTEGLPEGTRLKAWVTATKADDQTPRGQRSPLKQRGRLRGRSKKMLGR